MSRAIFFDLEGPLSPQDNAYELTRRILGDERGAAIFETISKYDDIISMEGRENYEPGDTLALILPFLLAHGVKAEDIRNVSENASLVSGARYLCDVLRAKEWKIFIISTSYEQHALNIGAKLGINPENIVCTRLDLNRISEKFNEKHASLIRKVEKELLELHRQLPLWDDKALMKTEAFSRLKERLDSLFFEELPEMGYDVFDVRVVGGKRKADALNAISARENVDLSDVIAVGDSITDAKMLEFVRQNGGLAVVFNGNEYAVPHASAGLASRDIRFLLILCDAYEQGGKEEALRTAEMWDEHREEWTNREDLPPIAHASDLIEFIRTASPDVKNFFLHDIEHADEQKLNEILAIHKKFRRIVREDAGKLG